MGKQHFYNTIDYLAYEYYIKENHNIPFDFDEFCDDKNYKFFNKYYDLAEKFIQHFAKLKERKEKLEEISQSSKL